MMLLCLSWCPCNQCCIMNLPLGLCSTATPWPSSFRGHALPEYKDGKIPPSHCKETSSSKSCSHFTRFGTAPYGNVLELHFLRRLDYFKNCVNWAQEPRFCNVSSCLWCSLKFENRWCNYRWKDAQPTSAWISRVRTPRRVVVMNQFRWKEERSQHSQREHRVKRVSDRKLHVWRIAVHRYFGANRSRWLQLKGMKGCAEPFLYSL